MLAVAILRVKGYPILGRRVAAPAGEIDIIAVRRLRLAFIEVKWHKSCAAGDASVTASRQTADASRSAALAGAT